MDEGKTFTLEESVAYASAETVLGKIGSGTLVLAGRCVSAGTLAVAEGSVVVSNAYALANLTTEVSDGAKLRMSALATSADDVHKIDPVDYLFIPTANYDTSKTAEQNLVD